MSDRSCAFCGGPDSRHRILDSIVEQCLAGDSVASVAENFLPSIIGISPERFVYDLVTAVLSDRGNQLLSGENLKLFEVEAEWAAFVERESGGEHYTVTRTVPHNQCCHCGLKYAEPQE